MSAAEFSRLDELVSRYLDHVLTDEEAAELLALLAEPSCAERFLETTRLNAEIAGLLSAPVPDAAMVELVRADLANPERGIPSLLESSLGGARLRQAQSSLDPQVQGLDARNSIEENSLLESQRTVSGPDRGVPSSVHAEGPSFRPRHVRRVRPAWAWAAVILTLVALAAAWFARRDAVDVSPALVSWRGDVRLLENGGTRFLTKGDVWLPGRTLEVVDSAGAATVLFRDGTRLDLAGDSVVVNRSGNAGHRVELWRGQVRAEVRKQPAGREFVFVTPEAEAVVVGTVLELSADAHHTLLRVTEGQVLVKRRADGKELMVGAGFHIFVGTMNNMRAVPNVAGHPHH